MMRKFILSLGIFALFILGGMLAARQASAEIAYGSLTSTSAGGAWHTTVTLAAAPTVTGSNTVMIFTCTENGGGELPPTTATYDGVDLGVAVGTVQINYTRTTVWILKNPASAKAFTVTFPSNTAWSVILTAFYYTGVDQTTVYRTATTATGLTTPATLGVTNSQTNDLIVGVFGLNDTTDANGMTSARIGAGQTFRFQLTEAAGAGTACSIGDEPGASGTVTHSWTFVENADNGWAEVAVPLIPAAAAAPTSASAVLQGSRINGAVILNGQ